MNKILITGGSGFIGTNLVLDLLNSGFKILNIDIEPSPVKEINEYTQICDIRNFNTFKSIVESFDPEYIVHLAARTDLDGKNIDDYDSNTVGVDNLVKLTRKLPNLQKVIFTSSMLVCRGGYMPKDEDDYNPNTIYGESKIIGEKIVKEADLNYAWSIIRPTSIWGPWFKVPYKNFFDMIRNGTYFHVGHKSSTKTYGFVGNSIYQIKELLFNNSDYTNKHVFYIGDGLTNIEEWANEIANAFNKKILRIPFPILKLAASVGDGLKKLNIRFPLTSFRLNNMISDNKVDLSKTKIIAPNNPYTRIEGIQKTKDWYLNSKK